MPPPAGRVRLNTPAGRGLRVNVRCCCVVGIAGGGTPGHLPTSDGVLKKAACAVCKGTSGGSPRSVSSGSGCGPSGRRARRRLYKAESTTRFCDMWYYPVFCRL